MTDQTTDQTTSTPTKTSLKDRVLRKGNPTDATVKTASNLKEKAKTGFAVVGVVAVAGLAASKIAKARGVDQVSVTLPDVDVTNDAS